MHRLLIVDDDQIIRAGMKRSIHWEENDIEVVGTAGNGRECLEMIPSCLPDIILTDIKMPFMDGVELVEAVYRLYPHIKVVLLTAYGDFKYAQLALNYKVCQYVMKALSLVGTAIALGVTQLLFKRIRVTSEEEALGLDFCEHGEPAYPAFDGVDSPAVGYIFSEADAAQTEKSYRTERKSTETVSG